MKWKKVPEEHRQAFLAALPDEPDVDRKPMFGCPAAFVNGNLFAGAHEDRINLRLDAATREQCLSQGFSPFEPMGRTMKGYACVPSGSETDVEFLRPWLRRAYEFGRSLPPKPVKPKATPKPKR
ncbi:MAG: hypothetical protein GC160_11080 [Acidobacteria bacterium]|nr:hypothetical protein [Acidobacteriota bacterium]